MATVVDTSGWGWPPLVILVAVPVVVCFLVGSVNPAAVVGRALGQDVRQAGSGNPGATNVGRVLGVRWGILVGLLDVLKGFIPVWLVLRALGAPVAAVCGLAVVCGHIWSPFLGGHGGKGVATSLGAMLALAPWFGLLAVVLFALAIWMVRTTGLASVVVCVLLVLLGLLDALGLFGSEDWRPGAWVAVVSLLVLARHHRNIRAWIRLTRS